MSRAAEADGLPREVDHTAALEANLVDHYSNLARLPGSTFVERPDLCRYVSGLPANFFNAVVRARFEADEVDDQIEETLRPFRERGLPARWWLGPSDSPTDLRERLVVQGMEHRVDAPGMALELSDLNEDLPEPRGLTVERVRDAAGLDVFVRAFFAAGGRAAAERDAWSKALGSIGVADGEPLRHHVGFLDGRPVATSSVHMGPGGIVGVYHVATHPEVRRLGIGSAVTLASLLDARMDGSTVCVLKSSSLGYGVYRRLGFEERCHIGLYRLSP